MSSMDTSERVAGKRWARPACSGGSMWAAAATAASRMVRYVGSWVGKVAYKLSTRDWLTAATCSAPSSVTARNRVRPSVVPASRVAYPWATRASTAWVTTLGFMPRIFPSSPWLTGAEACISFVKMRYWVMFRSLACSNPRRRASWAISKATKYVESRLNLFATSAIAPFRLSES